MGNIFGIVAEFNPFHNGHKALITEARRAGHTHCVAVMSGNFVQRGEPAIVEKRVRARMALLEGADLVLDLPVGCAAATAQKFALGAVSLLKATGCVETLCFGSECGDLSLLQTLAKAVDSLDLNFAPYLEQGMTFARARSLALAELLGQETAAHLEAPNNLLAVEYLRAARALGWEPGVFTINRMGAAHDGQKPSGRYASASLLRSQADRPDVLRRYIPPRAFRALEDAREEGLFPVDYKRMEQMMFSYLRRLSPEDLSVLPGLSEGIEQRLYGAIRTATSMEELLWKVKTKRYPLARVRRLVLHAYLGLCEQDTLPPPYLRVLGMNRRGREILTRMKGTAVLPISPSLARLEKLNPECARTAHIEALSTDLYTAALPCPLPCGYEYTASGIYLEKG